MEKGEIKFSKLAITSFVLVCVGVIILILGFIKYYSFVAFVIGSFLFLLSLTTSIISLFSIKKHNLRGKAIAWIALILSLLAALFLISLNVGVTYP